MREGQALTQLVEFTDGFPDGAVSWSLLDGAGASVATGSVTPDADSASTIITVTGAQNAIEAGALASPRELSWAYTVGGLVHTGRRRYRLEAFLPFGVSEDGVRRKLGLESHELEDEAIDLVAAYIQFRDTVTAGALGTVDQFSVATRDGIEALAALAALPTLSVKLAAKQSSGTDQFQRTAIDWANLTAQLQRLVALGYAAVDPLLDLTTGFGSLLRTVDRDDPVTGTVA